MTDFASLLNVNTDEIKEMPVLPQGSYMARVGQYKFEMAKTKDGEKPVVNIPIQLISAVQVAGEVPPRLPELKQTYWLTNQDGGQDEYTLNGLKLFIEACGADTSGRPIGQALNDTPNATVTVEVGHRQNPRNPARPFADIKSFGRA